MKWGWLYIKAIIKQKSPVPAQGNRAFAAGISFGDGLFTAEQVMNLELEHRGASAGYVNRSSNGGTAYCGRSCRSRTAIFEHLGDTAYVPHSDAQAVSNLVANAAYVINSNFVKVISAGYGRANLASTAVLGEKPFIYNKAALGSDFKKQTLTIVAEIIFK